MPQSTVQAKALAGKAVAHGTACIVTSEAVVTAAGATYTLTIGNSAIRPDSVVLPVVSNGTNTQGDPTIQTVTVSLGQVVINVVNRHATQALNGTLKISLLVA